MPANNPSTKTDVRLPGPVLRSRPASRPTASGLEAAGPALPASYARKLLRKWALRGSGERRPGSRRQGAAVRPALHFAQPTAPSSELVFRRHSPALRPGANPGRQRPGGQGEPCERCHPLVPACGLPASPVCGSVSVVVGQQMSARGTDSPCACNRCKQRSRLSATTGDSLLSTVPPLTRSHSHSSPREAARDLISDPFTLGRAAEHLSPFLLPLSSSGSHRGVFTSPRT